MAIPGLEKEQGSDNKLYNIVRLLNQMQVNQERKIEKKSSNLENLIKLTSDMDTMTSLGNRVKEADVDFDSMGDDETGDTLLLLYQTKFDVMKKGQDAFNKLNEMNLSITDQESFSNTSKNIIDMNWAEVNKNMRQLYLHENDLSNALKLGVTFKGSDNVSPELLQTTVQQYKGFYNNKFNLLAQRNVFDIPDEDIQAFDEEFGVALMTYGPEQFSRFMGGHQKLIQNKLSDAEQKRNMYYNHYVRAGQEGGFAKASEDLGVFGEVSPGTVMATGFYEEKYKEYQNTAQLLNERHKEFYGSYFNDNPSLIKGHVSSDKNILDGAVNQFLGTQDKDKDEEIKTERLTGDILKDTSLKIKDKVFRRMRNRESQGLSTSPVINALSEDIYGDITRKNRDKIIKLYGALKEKRIEGKGEVSIRPPKDSPERTAILNYEFVKEEAGKKNIAQAWSKNPKMYNESIKPYIDDVLLKTKDINDIIKFGQEMKSVGINLGKKGAFPGLQKEINRLEGKIISLIGNESQPEFINAYTKQINKAFSWANLFIAPFTGEVKARIK